MRPSDEVIRAVLLDVARARGSGATFCPSEVARCLADDWRPLMEDVRRVAGDLRDAGVLQATRRGIPVDPRQAGGAIRLGLADG